MKKICELCGQPLPTKHKKRSIDISTHFHAHITQIARDTAQDRNYVYMKVLLLACEIEIDGGSPYPYTIVDDILYPHRTTNRSNSEMMTAVGAVHQYAAEAGVSLRETIE